MGVQKILVIGNRRIGTHGSHGAQTRVSLLHFWTWAEALAYLRLSADRLRLYGVARFASETSQDAAAFNFVADAQVDDTAAVTAVFVIGDKEGVISPDLRSQLAAELHVSLPVPAFAGRFHYDSILTIVLHRFATAPSHQAQLVGALPRMVGGACAKFELDATVNQRGRVQRGSVALAAAIASGGGSRAALDAVGAGAEGDEGVLEGFSSLFITTTTP